MRLSVSSAFRERTWRGAAEEVGVVLVGLWAFLRTILAVSPSIHLSSDPVEKHTAMYTMYTYTYMYVHTCTCIYMYMTYMYVHMCRKLCTYI